MKLGMPNSLLFPLLPAALLAAWLVVSLRRTLRDLRTFEGFERMHLEPDDFELNATIEER